MVLCTIVLVAAFCFTFVAMTHEAKYGRQAWVAGPKKTQGWPITSWLEIMCAPMLKVKLKI